MKEEGVCSLFEGLRNFVEQEDSKQQDVRSERKQGQENLAFHSATGMNEHHCLLSLGDSTGPMWQVEKLS